MCVELKGLKLYLWSYRDLGAFHEDVTNRIPNDIVAAVDPRWARIGGDWNVLGGIRTKVAVRNERGGVMPGTLS